MIDKTSLIEFMNHQVDAFFGHRHLSLKVPNIKFDFDVKFLALMYP